MRFDKNDPRLFSDLSESKQEPPSYYDMISDMKFDTQTTLIVLQSDEPLSLRTRIKDFFDKIFNKGLSAHNE